MSVEKTAEEQLFLANRNYLEDIAAQAIQRGRQLDEITAVCLNVDDPVWTGLAHDLLPNHDWQSYRDRGELPIVRGLVYSGLDDYFRATMPEFMSALESKRPNNKVRTLIMDDGGLSVYFLTPIRHMTHSDPLPP